MKAIVLNAYGGVDTLKLADIDEPEPAAGELKVRVAAAGINPVDWKLRSGALRGREPLELPAVLGRDVSGEVVAVGEGVTGFAAGDRVMTIQRDAARTLGAERVVSLDDPADVARLPELDAIADTIDGQALAGVLDKVRPGGVVGSVVGDSPRAKQLKLRVNTLLAHPDPERLAELGRDAAAGGFRLPIDWSFPLAEAQNAHRLAEAHGVGKVILTP
jgi:NADPH:quinone reductase-like Zn-dependent oxidoreductase